MCKNIRKERDWRGYKKRNESIMEKWQSRGGREDGGGGMEWGEGRVGRGGCWKRESRKRRAGGIGKSHLENQLNIPTNLCNLVRIRTSEELWAPVQKGDCHPALSLRTLISLDHSTWIVFESTVPFRYIHSKPDTLNVYMKSYTICGKGIQTVLSGYSWAMGSPSFFHAGIAMNGKVCAYPNH